MCVRERDVSQTKRSEMRVYENENEVKYRYGEKEKEEKCD